MKDRRRFVPDASAILKWYLDEALQKEALRVRSDYLTGVIDLVVPSFAFAELLNRLERQEGIQSRDLFDLFALLPSKPTTDEDLIRTFELVRKLRRSGDKRITVYDALYVQLAMAERATLISCDEVQVRAAKKCGCQVMLLQD